MVYNTRESVLDEGIPSIKKLTEDIGYNYRSLLSYCIRCTANTVHRCGLEPAF